MSDEKRDQSSIQFPYVDLDETIKLAGAMLARGGVPLDRDQLASAVGQVPNSGAFGAKVAAARMFGIIESNQGKYALTPLGFDILETSRAPAAKAEAFLNVPLYKRMFEEFRGRQLPPRPAGLEQAMVSLGVAKKQKERARQTFDRSARTAGFFSTAAEDRLVQPVVFATSDAPVEAVATAERSPPPPQPEHTTQATQRPRLHFFIEGLLDELPPAKSEWPSDARAKWLDAAAHAFDLIYKGGTGDILIEVKVTKEAG
ncbi:hypothetical protein [Terricaulis sp.]|uniref:hypothetical protein n=1 Tax=Terricaulis sp. TaxID=2768686 RepID=UPI002AC3E3E0|nr:hypothetical protein [Terricaulis sp.]MDZ4693429.1 hypothetical protein [Terricaulis sp.]